jgi:hypothetical protein
VLDFSSALGAPVPVRSARSVLIGYGNARLKAEIAGHVFSAIIKTSIAGRKDDRGEQQAARGGIRSPKSQLSWQVLSCFTYPTGGEDHWESFSRRCECGPIQTIQFWKRLPAAQCPVLRFFTDVT